MNKQASKQANSQSTERRNNRPTAKQSTVKQSTTKHQPQPTQASKPTMLDYLHRRCRIDPKTQWEKQGRASMHRT
jgi:hypothetical protein